MDIKDIKRGIGRHHFVYSFLRVIFGIPFAAAIGYKYEKYKPKSSTFLMLGNHVEKIDPIKAVITTGKHMRFVASTNVLKGFAGSCIKFLAGPIPREKGASADSTVELIIDNLKAGISVGMFPEGRRTWDGQTGFFSKRTATILKEADCGLITMRFEATPLKHPRWGHVRKGKTYGHVVCEYTAEDLKNMSVDEIYECIKRDIYTDAYEWQKQHMISYPCKEGRAEGIEKIILKCPTCGKLCCFQSSGDVFWCESCESKYSLNEYDLIEKSDGKSEFDTITSWNNWQKEQFAFDSSELKKQLDTPIFTDESVVFSSKDNNIEQIIAQNVNVSLFGDRIEITNTEKNEKNIFYLEKISALGGFGGSSIMFTYIDKQYVLYAKYRMHEYKYFALWRVLTNKVLA